MGPVLGKDFGDSFADSPTRSGNDHIFAFQKFHKLVFEYVSSKYSGCCAKSKKKSRLNGIFNGSFFAIYPMTSFTLAPISAGESTTWIPQSRMIFFLAWAVSSLPPTMPPAWP